MRHSIGDATSHSPTPRTTKCTISNNNGENSPPINVQWLRTIRLSHRNNDPLPPYPILFACTNRQHSAPVLAQDRSLPLSRGGHHYAALAVDHPFAVRCSRERYTGDGQPVFFLIEVLAGRVRVLRGSSKQPTSGHRKGRMKRKRERERAGFVEMWRRGVLPQICDWSNRL